MLFCFVSMICKKHLKKNSTILVIRNTHIKIILRFIIPVIIPRSIEQKTAHSGKDVGYGENSSIADGTVNL